MKLIKTEIGIIAVGEEYVSAGNNGGIVYATIAGTPDTLKLKFSPEVADVLGVWDAEEEYKKQIELENYHDNTMLLTGFIVGFEKHSELTKKKEFTEDYIKAAFKAGHERGYSGYPNTENFSKMKVDEFIQSLREFEVETFEIIGDTLTILKLK